MNPSGRYHGSGRRRPWHVDSNDHSGRSAPSSSNLTYNRDARSSYARSTRITLGGPVNLVEIEPRDREQQTADGRARRHWAGDEGHVPRGTLHDADITEIEPRGTHHANAVPSFPPPPESAFWTANLSGLYNVLDDLKEIDRHGALTDNLHLFALTLDNMIFVNMRADLRNIRSSLQDAIAAVQTSLAIVQGQAPAPGAATESSISRLPKIKLDESKVDSNGTADCGICLQSFGLGHEVMELPCHHWYCKQCIRTWLRRHDSCPQCRRGIMPPSAANEDEMLEQHEHLTQDNTPAPEPQRISRRRIRALLAPYLTDRERQMIAQAHELRRYAYMQETTVPRTSRSYKSQSNVPGRLFHNDPPPRPRPRGVDLPTHGAEDGLTDVWRELVVDMERENRARGREG